MSALSHETATDRPDAPVRRTKLARSLATAFAVVLCVAAVAGCSDSKKSASSSSSGTPTTSQTDGLLQQGLDARQIRPLHLDQPIEAEAEELRPEGLHLGRVGEKLVIGAASRDLAEGVEVVANPGTGAYNLKLTSK